MLGACAGYRGGWDSVAYVGDTPPATPRRNDGLDLPGHPLLLTVSINNRLRTRDTQVMLVAVPVSIDPRDVYTEAGDGKRTRVFLRATPTAAGWVFRPTAVVLSFGGRRLSAERGHLFDQWDAQGRPVERGGRYEHKPIEGALALDDVGRRYLLSVDFATPPPDPQARDIELDLSAALRTATHPALPRVRFVPVRWEEGYT